MWLQILIGVAGGIALALLIIMSGKWFVKPPRKKIMYTGVVLHMSSVQQLLAQFPVPIGWKVKAHHMTINMGDITQGPASTYLGQTVELKVVSVAYDERVMAVGVECIVPSVNTHKHVTLAINESVGGKAVMSNYLTNWQPCEPFTLVGTVAEVTA